MSTTVYAVYGNQFAAKLAYGELYRHGFNTKFVPISTKEVSYKNHTTRIKQILASALTSLVIAFLIGGLIGSLDGFGLIKVEGLRPFLLGQNFLTSLNLSNFNIHLLSWAFSLSILGLIVGGVAATIYHDSYLIEVSMPQQEVMVAVPGIDQESKTVTEILSAHKPLNLAAI